MKSKIFISLLVLAARVTGFVIGRWRTEDTGDSFIDRIIMPKSETRRATADFSKAAGVLKEIRAGDTNAAMEDLESELDTQILYIGAVTEATPVSKRDKQWLSRLRWLADYRAKYPRKGNPFIDGQVAHYLSLVETNK